MENKEEKSISYEKLIMRGNGMGRRKKRVSGHTGWVVWGKKSRKAEVSPRQLGKKQQTKNDAERLANRYKNKGFIAHVLPTYPR